MGSGFIWSPWTEGSESVYTSIAYGDELDKITKDKRLFSRKKPQLFYYSSGYSIYLWKE